MRIKNELIEDGLTIDWNYYRNDKNIDQVVKEINESCMR
jgi:hypothetical protein